MRQLQSLLLDDRMSSNVLQTLAAQRRAQATEQSLDVDLRAQNDLARMNPTTGHAAFVYA